MSLAQAQREFARMLACAVPPADPRLAIYHRAARAARSIALGAAYPVVRRLVGDSFFEAMAADFLAAFPPPRGDLHAYGAELPVFLEAYGPARTLPYLPDMARLEWALHECLHEADDAPLDVTRLARIPPARHALLRFRLARACRLLDCRFAVVCIWEANRPDRDGSVDPPDGAERVLVRRNAFEPLPQTLDDAEWAFLRQVQAGSTLGDIIEGAGGHASRVPLMLQRFVALGALCDFVPAG